MKLILCLVSVLCVRAQSVQNGAVYQAAAGAGIAYISPATGAQIISQKASLNWKSLVGTVASTGTISAVVLGLTKTIAMSTPWTVGLSLAHEAWDTWGAQVFATAAPNPSTLLLGLLQPGQATALNGGCADSYILASMPKKPPVVGPVNIAGVAVVFSPQNQAVVVNATGSRIKDVGVYDVLMCPWIVAPTEPLQLSKPGNAYVTPPGVGQLRYGSNDGSIQADAGNSQ